MALHRVSFRAMAAENEVQLHAASEAEARELAQAAIDEVQRIEAKYSRCRADSVLSRINAAGGGAPVEIDEEKQSVLHYAGAVWRQSGGPFGATYGVARSE